MSTTSRPHHTANAGLLHGAVAAEVAAPLDGNHNFQGTAADAHDVLLCAPTEEDNNACGGRPAADGGDGASFGDFFFHSLPPAGGDDAAQPAVFEGFCFDDICGDGAWPTGGTAMDEAPGEAVEDGNQPRAPPPFDFLLSEDATSTRVAAAVGRGTGEEAVLDMESAAMLHPNCGVADLTSAPVAVSAELPQQSAAEATKKLPGETAVHFPSTTTDTIEAACMAPVALGSLSTRQSNGGNDTSAEGATATTEVVNSAHSLPFGSLRQSLKLNDISVSSAAESAITAVGVAPRVPRESVDELLRRANRILSDGDSADAAQSSAEGGSARQSNQSDTLFSAQVSHWLRRCVEVQEASLAAVADLQLRTTNTMRLFSAHSGLSSALGPQYGKTPVVLTLPLVLPLMESLLEEV
ncbi:uncharacterized protein Tco025E_02853 [Trypanosoma conorhini]|uniref:Uncharacterized protein n=1 Tax=Trypanosoma conorhini TaxID=83891 RepID=A0A422Q0V3_9TRYP|nr:uncharacterized protein Tco025E_02853 [Trypanosoma conorhini]RNF23631.1 hypothetical protein Tco025E_02853 [Trypanosoma conorhini]